MRHVAFLSVLGIAVCSMPGCGPGVKVVDVTGRVTYNGKPPNEEGCHIVFLGSNGKSVDAAILPDGSYKASGVVAGENKVAVYYRSPAAAKTREAGEAPTPPSESPLRNLPPKYADAQKSGLTFDAGTSLEFSPDLTGADLGSQPTKPPPRKKNTSGGGKPHKS